MKKTMTAAVCIMAWAALSAGGKSEALRVTSLMVDPKTKIIRGAESTSLYFNLAEGIHAITNDIWKAVRAKKFARYNKPEIDMQKGTGHVEHFCPVNGGQQWIELKTQFVMSKNGMMSINSLLHVMGDQINTKPMCQK